MWEMRVFPGANGLVEIPVPTSGCNTWELQERVKYYISGTVLNDNDGENGMPRMQDGLPSSNQSECSQEEWDLLNKHFGDMNNVAHFLDTGEVPKGLSENEGRALRHKVC